MSNYAEQLSSLMSRRGWSQGDIAKKIGMSNGAVSAYLSDSYKGNMNNITDKVVSLIRKENKKDGLTSVQTGFVMTETAVQMEYVADFARDDGDIVAIIGGAGLGKTSFLMHYANKHPDTILIETDPSFTARGMLEELCKKLDIKKRGNMHTLTEAIVDKLKGSDHVLLIDEAELLPYRALEVVRRIHDKAGVGVILVGLERLLTNLKGRRGEFLQLYSRVGCCLNIGNELPVDDIHAITRQVISYSDESLLSKFYEKSGGNARRLAKLICGSIRMAEGNNKPVSAAIVDKFSEMLIK
ncbi:AAA family ATPase [Enterobacter kobei]